MITEHERNAAIWKMYYLISGKINVPSNYFSARNAQQTQTGIQVWHEALLPAITLTFSEYHKRLLWAESDAPSPQVAFVPTGFLGKLIEDPGTSPFDGLI